MNAIEGVRTTLVRTLVTAPRLKSRIHSKLVLRWFRNSFAGTFFAGLALFACVDAHSQAPPVPSVTYQGGLLTIVADNATLGDVLNRVRKLTGSAFEIPHVPAMDERVAVRLGPASVPSVLADLLDGSSFDYVIVGSGEELGSIYAVISERSAGPGTPSVGPKNSQPFQDHIAAQPTLHRSEGSQTTGGEQTTGRVESGWVGVDNAPEYPKRPQRPPREGPRVLPPPKQPWNY
jgi:hypothetical protein